MIIIMLEKNGGYFSFTINNKNVTGVMGIYKLPYLPPNLAEVDRIILLSRNKLPAWFGQLFRLTELEKKEFESALDDEALKEIILKDAKREGCRIIEIKTI